VPSAFSSLSTSTVHIDDRAVFEMLNTIDGPVGRYLLGLSEQAADIARSVVRVREKRSGRRRPGSRIGNTARPPGFTKASIHTDMYWDAQGLIYGGVAADFAMTVFLETPAQQMHDRYPFLSTAIETLEL